MPLLGAQPELTQHMKELSSELLPKRPRSIVVFSAHWEEQTVKITSHERPHLYFDYHGFPKETYEYKYPAPGSPELAKRIQSLLEGEGIKSDLDEKRGFDHGVFVPLMLMYPEADIPVVCVSLHGSLDGGINMRIGKALEHLRNDGILILGSGYTFHNMQAFFNPTYKTTNASVEFNDWLKDTILNREDTLDRLRGWETAPGARIVHPREEHLIPLLMTAAAGGIDAKSTLIFESKATKETHAVSGYMFA